MTKEEYFEKREELNSRKPKIKFAPSHHSGFE